MTSRVHDMVSDAFSVLAEHDLHAVIEYRGSHLKVRVTDSQGRRHLLVLPSTPSGPRSRANVKAMVRRLARGWVAPAPVTNAREKIM
jgi:hypothetical protein